MRTTELPPEADVIFQLPVPVGDMELDRLIDHAYRYGRVLYEWAGRVCELTVEMFGENDG